MNKKLRDLLVAAERRTAAGRLTWRPFNERIFHANVGSGVLKVGREWADYVESDRTVTGGDVLSVWVTNSKGQVVAECEVTDRDDPDYAVMERLFETVRASALDTDGVLDEMLAALSTSG